jgi:hypothetical protein
MGWDGIVRLSHCNSTLGSLLQRFVAKRGVVKMDG